MSRRQFLFLGGGALVGLAIPAFLADIAEAKGLSMQMAPYPRKRIGKLSQLQAGHPVAFNYPYEHPNCTNYLYKLRAPAGGGVGPEKDVVAFNSLCPHQGVSLAGRFDPEHQVAGACLMHLSTFDLTRHGMVISGHATENLPQIVLELEGDDIYATGVMGLVFGFHDNRVAPKA